MICDVKFVRALKSTWIRITLWKRGKDFIVNLHIYNKISNNFWREVLLYWIRIVQSYSQNDIKVFNEQIWYISNIRFHNSSIC